MHNKDFSFVAKRTKYLRDEKTDLSFYLSIIYHLLMICLGFATLTVAIIGYCKMNAYNYAMQDFKDNWESLPLVDIKATEGECPVGYEELINRKWPGTVLGCDCTKSWLGEFPDIIRGACTKNETYYGCSNIQPEPSIPLHKFYNHTICGLREGENFVETQRPTLKQNGELKCSLGHKICGKGKNNLTYRCAKELLRSISVTKSN